MSIGTKQERNENSVVVCMDFLFLKLIYKEIDNVIGKLIDDILYNSQKFFLLVFKACNDFFC